MIKLLLVIISMAAIANAQAPLDPSAAGALVELKSFRLALNQKLPSWFFNKNLILENIQWLGILFIFLFSFIIDRLVKLYVANKVVSLLSKAKIIVNEKMKKKLSTSIGLLAFAYSFKFAILVLDLPSNFLLAFTKLTDIVIVVSTILALGQFIDLTCLYLEKKAKLTENKFDDILIPLVRKTLRFFVYSIGLVLIGDALSINMKNILATMGIGGIAFALAAKDSISNILGSFTVLMDRPFSIGDWVKIDDKIEGTILEVGLRSTRIKTFYDSVITVPNGNLTNAYIDNYGKREYRRFTTKLGVDYSTPVEKLENFCEGIRQLIIEHPHTRKDYFHVYFTDLGDSALEILLYVFWKVPNWSCELNERHNLLLDIMRLAKEMNISFAFPTQTLNVINEQKLKHQLEDISYPKAREVVKTISKTRALASGHRSGANSLKS